MSDSVPIDAVATQSGVAVVAHDSITVVLVLAGDDADNSINLLQGWSVERATLTDREVTMIVVLAGVTEGHERVVRQFVDDMGASGPRIVLTAPASSLSAGLAAVLEPRHAPALARWCILWAGSVEPRRGWLTGLAEVLDDDAPPLVQPLSLQRDGTISSAGGVLGPGRVPEPYLRGLPPEDAERQGDLIVGMPFTQVIAVRTVDLRRLGGFDERYAGGFAEIDFAARLGDASIVRVVTGARVVSRAPGRFGFSNDRTSGAAALVAQHAAWLDCRPAPVGMRAEGEDGAIGRWPRLRWAIDIATPGDDRRYKWGDWLFAKSLARALERLGQDVAIDTKSSRSRDSRKWDDVVLVLRGLDRCRPVDGAVNLLWVISHPDEVTVEEIAEFDAAFAASATWAPDGVPESAAGVRPLLQCTDPEIFNPSAASLGAGHPLVFVGNSRGTSREIVTGAVDAGLVPAVYGSGWAGLIDSSLVVEEFVDPARVARLYSSSDFVLADHWPDMRREGFISNRVFDVLASGGTLITDDVAGLDSLGLSAVITIREPRDWLQVRSMSASDLEATRAERLVQAARVAEEHSFDARARALLERALELGASSARSSQLGEPRDAALTRSSRPRRTGRRRSLWSRIDAVTAAKARRRPELSAGLILLLAAITALQISTSRWDLSGLLALGGLLVVALALSVRQNRSLHRVLRSMGKRLEETESRVRRLDRRMATAGQVRDQSRRMTGHRRQLEEEHLELSVQIATLAADVRGLGTVVREQHEHIGSTLRTLAAGLAADGHEHPSEASADIAIAANGRHVSEHMFVDLRADGLVPRVVLVLDSFTPHQIFAGVRTALLAAVEVAVHTGRGLRVIVMREPQVGLEAAKELLREWIVGEAGSTIVGETAVIETPSQHSRDGFHPDDQWIATYWTTAVAVRSVCDQRLTVPSNVIYIVQDWEPGFFPWGTRYATAANTLRYGYRLLVNSRPLAQYLTVEAAATIPDHAVFAPQIDERRLRTAAAGWKPGNVEQPRLLFYARPSKPRNLYELGLDGLRAWINDLPEGVRPRISLVGEDDLGDVNFGSRAEVECLGKLDLDAYYRLLERIDIGLTLMLSPHPSHLPLELPMAGIPTVTNELQRYRKPWLPGLQVCATDASSLADGLAECWREAQGRRFHAPVPLPLSLGDPLPVALRSVLHLSKRGLRA